MGSLTNINEEYVKNENTLMKTGTTGLGLRYKDGVLIAADKRMSAGYVAGKNAEKIHALTKTIAMSISGLVSDAMNLVDVMRSELKIYQFENGYEPTVKVATSLLGLITHSAYRRYFPYYVQLIVGGVDSTGGHIYNIDPSGAVIEDNYTVVGSGSLFALSKLEDGYTDNLSKEQAKELAKKALSLAISRDLYTGDGMDFFFITKDGIERETIKLKPTEVKN